MLGKLIISMKLARTDSALTMPKRGSRIAGYAVKETADIALGSTELVAKRVDVSPVGNSQPHN